MKKLFIPKIRALSGPRKSGERPRTSDKSLRRELGDLSKLAHELYEKFNRFPKTAEEAEAVDLAGAEWRAVLKAKRLVSKRLTDQILKDIMDHQT
jgi:hypothetical protein